MLKNKILLITFFVLCTVLSGTKIIFAQAVTDNSKDQAQVNAAADRRRQAGEPVNADSAQARKLPKHQSDKPAANQPSHES